MGKKSREKKEKIGKIKSQTSLEKTCLAIISLATYFILFTPLIFSNKFYFPFVAPKSLYFMALAEIIFFSWLILIINFPQYRPGKNPILIALILFLAALTLSTFFGENLSYSFWSKPERMTGLLMWFHLFAFFLVISSTFQKSDWQKIFALSLFVGVILSLITFFSKNPAMRGGATIGNDSFLGSYLLFVLFLALYLIFTSQKELRIYSIFSFLIIFLALFLSGARAAKLSFLGGLVLLSFLYLIFIPQKRALKFLGIGLLGASFLVFLVGLFLIFQPNNFFHQKFIELSTKSRLVVWQGAWKGFLERPWLGWGPENFEFVFAKYFNPCMFLPECGGEIWFDRAHNIIFDTLVATGIFGFLTYIGIFLSVFYLLWKRYFQQKIEFWTAGIFSVLLVAYFVQNLTVFDMISSYLMFFLVLGFVVSITTAREVSLLAKISFPNYWVISFILLLFVFSFFKFVIQPLKTDYYVISALRSAPASPERLSYYQKALRTSPLGKYQIRDFFGRQTLAFAQEFAQPGKIREVSIDNFKKEIDFVIEELEKNIKESPLDLRSHLTLGQLYNFYATSFDQEKFLKAERILEEAIEISPTNQQGYWNLAQTKIYQKKFEEALSLAEKAIRLEPKLFQSHLIIIQIAKLMVDDQLAKKKAEQAIEINPQWESELKEILKNN